ncbi:MAG: hypothetical protein K1X50_02705 [Candidatus Promineofilum sp.]|nr:hypothetical protein [Promineifilum sp.]
MIDNPMDALERAEQATQRREQSGKGPTFSQPTERVSRETQRNVTTSDAKRAGQFDRKTIYITPEMIEWVSKTAADEGIGLLAFYRFLLAAGREAYEKGDAVPEPAPPLIHRLKTDPH